MMFQNLFVFLSLSLMGVLATSHGTTYYSDEYLPFEDVLLHGKQFDHSNLRRSRHLQAATTAEPAVCRSTNPNLGNFNLCGQSADPAVPIGCPRTCDAVTPYECMCTGSSAPTTCGYCFLETKNQIICQISGSSSTFLPPGAPAGSTEHRTCSCEILPTGEAHQTCFNPIPSPDPGLDVPTIPWPTPTMVPAVPIPAPIPEAPAAPVVVPTIAPTLPPQGMIPAIPAPQVALTPAPQVALTLAPQEVVTLAPQVLTTLPPQIVVTLPPQVVSNPEPQEGTLPPATTMPPTTVRAEEVNPASGFCRATNMNQVGRTLCGNIASFNMGDCTPQSTCASLDGYACMCTSSSPAGGSSSMPTTCGYCQLQTTATIECQISGSSTTFINAAGRLQTCACEILPDGSVNQTCSI